MFSQDVSRELYDNESPTTTKEVMHTPYHIDAHTLVTQRTLVTDPPSTLSTDPKNIMPSYNSIFTFKFTFYNLLTCQTYLVYNWTLTKFRSVVRRRRSVSPSVRCSQMTVCFRNANIGWVGAVCHNVRRSSVSKRALLSDDCV